jgi:hypothetical protein
VESRWVLGPLDPTLVRGNVEWDLDIWPATAGALGYARRPWFFSYLMDSSAMVARIGDPADTGNQLFVHGNLLVGSETDGLAPDGSLAVTKDFAHRGTKVGFFNAAPIPKPSGSVLAALSSLGLVASPTLTAADITSGTMDVARMPSAGTWNLTSGLQFAGGAIGINLPYPASWSNALLSVKNSPSKIAATFIGSTEAGYSAVPEPLVQFDKPYNGNYFSSVAELTIGKWENAPPYSRTEVRLRLTNDTHSSVDVMTWRSNGTVGIGTTVPVEALDVNGNVKATGFRTNGTRGITTVITVRDSGGNADCTISVDGGIITATTCSHT